jgi:hypothetical protein
MLPMATTLERRASSEFRRTRFTIFCVGMECSPAGAGIARRAVLLLRKAQPRNSYRVYGKRETSTRSSIYLGSDSGSPMVIHHQTSVRNPVNCHRIPVVSTKPTAISVERYRIIKSSLTISVVSKLEVPVGLSLKCQIWRTKDAAFKPPRKVAS